RTARHPRRTFRRARPSVPVPTRHTVGPGARRTAIFVAGAPDREYLLVHRVVRQGAVHQGEVGGLAEPLDLEVGPLAPLRVEGEVVFLVVRVEPAVVAVHSGLEVSAGLLTVGVQIPVEARDAVG